MNFGCQSLLSDSVRTALLAKLRPPPSPPRELTRAACDALLLPARRQRAVDGLGGDGGRAGSRRHRAAPRLLGGRTRVAGEAAGGQQAAERRRCPGGGDGAARRGRGDISIPRRRGGRRCKVSGPEGSGRPGAPRVRGRGWRTCPLRDCLSDERNAAFVGNFLFVGTKTSSRSCA